MSIDFNGTTSKLENTTAAHSVTTLVTMGAWVFADGIGEVASGVGGSVLILGPGGLGTVTLGFMHHSTANKLILAASWTGTAGGYAVWDFPVTDGQWNYVCVSYDAGSASNDPVARVNGASVTVTETDIPSGTFNQSTTDYCVGNFTGQTNTWDGRLQDVTLANVIWTATEMDLSRLTPGCVTRGLTLHHRMIDASDLNDVGPSKFAGTGTALATGATNPPTHKIQWSDMMSVYRPLMAQ